VRFLHLSGCSEQPVNSTSSTLRLVGVWNRTAGSDGFLPFRLLFHNVLINQMFLLPFRTEEIEEILSTNVFMQELHNQIGITPHPVLLVSCFGLSG
jgi:hypothetical protein